MDCPSCIKSKEWGEGLTACYLTNLAFQKDKKKIWFIEGKKTILYYNPCEEKLVYLWHYYFQVLLVDLNIINGAKSPSTI